MIRLGTRRDIAEIERLTIEGHGIPASRLMDNAGRAIAAGIETDPDWDRGREIAVLCGPGNNGGDGRVIARALSDRGHRVRAWDVPREGPTDGELRRAGLIVDAIFGVGLNRAIEGPLRELIGRVNRVKARRAAVDLPSGLDADRGVVLGAAVRAHLTFACGLAKPGFFLNEGPAHCGRVRVVDVGFPRPVTVTTADHCFLARRKDISRLRPRSPATANKTHFGRVLVIGGAPGMEGAAVMTATAAARAGAGYVTLCSPRPISLDRRPPDFLSLPWERLGTEDLSRYQAIAIGPGLGMSSDRDAVLERVLEARVKTVVDADALSLVARSRHLALHADCVLTPHAGELSRLIMRTAKEIEADRLPTAEGAAMEYGALTLLKGFRTVVSDGRRSWIIGTGNAALAKAGSGDVLSGFIAGFAAQGLGLREAVVLGALVHGEIADQWVRDGRGRRTLMASDLPVLLAAALVSHQD